MTINPNIPAVPDPMGNLASLVFVAKQLKQGMDVFAGRFSQQLPFSRAATMLDLQTATITEQNARIAGDKASAQKVTFLIGDGATTTFVLKHNIGRKNNVVQLYHATTPYAQIDQFVFDPGTEGDPSIPTAGTLPSLSKLYTIENTDFNNTTIVFPNAPATNAVQVNVVG